jgi:hypothetical protein
VISFSSDISVHPTLLVIPQTPPRRVEWFKKGIDEGQTKEASVSPPTPERRASPSGERICEQCKNALAAD